MGPWISRLYIFSQSMSLNHSCCRTREAPPAMLPRRFETSTVQRPEIRSRAGADIAEGKRTLPSTILGGGQTNFTSHEGDRGSTVRRSSWDFDPRREADRQGIRTRGCQRPTSLLLCRDLAAVSLAHRPMIPDVPVFLMTSGARYSGVPHNVYVSPVHVNTNRARHSSSNILFSTFFANPKSTSFRCPSASMSMFSGFRSR